MDPDFLSLTDVSDNFIIRADYATEKNFTAQIVPGYRAAKALLARQPALALGEVQQKARRMGYSLLIFDAYRPVKAVTFFQAWAQLPETHPAVKEIYYPGYSRQELFLQGYLARQSSHSRGCAVDLSLVDLKTGEEVDMGTRFDFFDLRSHTNSLLVTPVQRANRLRLMKLMEEFGFINFYQEWWHYSYQPEPYPEHYFDFDVE